MIPERSRRSFSVFALTMVVTALVCADGSTAAQTRTRSSSRQLELEAVKTWPNKAKRWALVIGVDKYADTQITTLGGSANDAKALADSLVRYAGFPLDQVTLLASDQPVERQPTRGNILRRLSNLASVVPPDGLLLISFAGHGMERSGQAFLLPSDAQVSNDVDLLEQTAINVTQMKERIRKTGVKQVVLILDACRNDPVGRSSEDNRLTSAYVRGFNFDVRNREVTAFATLYATAVGHRAYEYKEKQQGYFTWELVEGLKGGAANERGEVTLESLIRYVQERVPKHVLSDLGAGKDQKPFAEIGGYRADELVIALGRPAKTASGAAAPPITSDTTQFPKVDPAAFELTYWETIKNSTDPEDFRSYLQRYPNGQFADLARRRAQQSVASGTNKSERQLSADNSSPAKGKPFDIPINQQPNQQTILLADILTLGINLGMAEITSYQNAAPAQIMQYLGYAREVAARSNLSLQGIDYVLGQLRAGAVSSTQYQNLLATRQGFEQALNRNCNCGTLVNFLNVYTLGGQLGFLQVVSYQNGDRKYLAQVMTLAISYATASGLPSSGLEELLRQINSAKHTRDTYSGIASVSNQLLQLTNHACGC
ncbi:MAG TPA: caspase family protein [Pyrinomonadaceae bacterium]|nr:caspase family protein [Pyrinomonadaceae bacterium]